MTDQIEQFTEEQIQQRLSGLHARGPRSFLGQPLAPWTAGIRDLVFKVVKQNDTEETFNALGVRVMLDGYAEDDPTGKTNPKLTKRRALIAATDDVETFRAEVSIWQDTLTKEDLATAAELINEILTEAKIAEVELAEKKRAIAQASLPSETLPGFGSSPAQPDGLSTSSAGS